MRSHQTVQLSKGRHRDPDHGTCVAELTSMLAGERFTDHPRCACPALTAFLRGYNDGIDRRKRQDLYRLASELVGTRADEARTTERGEALVALAWRHHRHLGPFRLSPITNFAIRFDRYQAAGLHLGKCARHSTKVHDEVLDLLVDLFITPVSRENEYRLGAAPAPDGEEVAQDLRAVVGQRT